MKKVCLATILLVFSVIALNLIVGRAGMDPAPNEDRVGFPEGYRENYKVLYVFDRPDNRQVRMIYGNDPAASIKPNEPFPYGSILVMETYPIQVDDNGQPLLDENGRYQRQSDEPAGIFVTRKEKGFGKAYEHNRTGEWEYVAYRPDRSYLTPPQQSASCAKCHLQAGPGKDWQFRVSLFLNQASGALPNSLMQHYLFVPDTLQVKPGTTVTWYNDDEVEHRIVIDSDSSNSGNMRQGASFSHTFSEAGEFNYHCEIHPQRMRGKVIVTGDKKAKE